MTLMDGPEREDNTQDHFTDSSETDAGANSGWGADSETDVGDTKSKDGAREQGTKHSILREYIQVAFWGFPLFLFVITFVCQNFKIPTSSMENSLLIGDHITVNTFVFSPTHSELDRTLMPQRDPRRGDVVVFKFPGESSQKWVKRLVGLPGEKLEIRDDQVFINDQPLDEGYSFYKTPNDPPGMSRDPDIAYRPRGYYQLEPGLEGGEYFNREYLNTQMLVGMTHDMLRRFRKLDPEIHKAVMDRLNQFDGVTIPEGFYFMAGDNRNRSYDSRRWGLVPRELIEGRPYWVWWSYGEDTGTHELKGVQFLWVYLRYPIEFWTRTHWEDCFRLIK